MTLLFGVFLAIPMVDLAFAISSNAAGKEETFQKIKDAIDFIITYYGNDRIRYAVVTFGSSSYDDVKFQDGRTVDELRQLIELLLNYCLSSAHHCEDHFHSCLYPQFKYMTFIYS